jgi:hypothetical protein
MENRTSKTALLVLVIAAVVWLGGLNVRAIVGFDLLQVGTLDFKPNIHPYIERTVYSLICQASMVVDIAYIVLWIAGILYLTSTSLNLKKEGWLLMVAILFYLFTPVEVYTMVLDYKMWLLDHIGSNDLVEFRTLFIHRLAALAGVPMIAQLCYYTAIAVAVFRPFRRTAA